MYWGDLNITEWIWSPRNDNFFSIQWYSYDDREGVQVPPVYITRIGNCVYHCSNKMFSPNDDDHKFFEEYTEIDDTQRETTRAQRGRVIKRTWMSIG